MPNCIIFSDTTGTLLQECKFSKKFPEIRKFCQKFLDFRKFCPVQTNIEKYTLEEIFTHFRKLWPTITGISDSLKFMLESMNEMVIKKKKKKKKKKKDNEKHLTM